MNKPMLKKIGIGAFATAAVVALIFYIISAKSDEPVPSYVDPAFGEFVSSYSSGVLGSGATIKIMLAEEVIDSTMIGKTSSVKLFSISPSLKGEAVWLDRRTVEFRPENRMSSGQIYNVEFALSKLIKVPDNLKVFAFSFQVMPQNFEITINNILPYVKTELKKQKIEGLLQTADYASSEAVEKMMEAIQENKNLSVTWVHDGEGTHHNFTVENVERKDAAGKVTLKVDGNKAGVDRKEEQEIEIPSLSDFKLMTTKIVQNPSQYAILQFSDPLKEKQNLNGLITINEISGTLDFEIHDNEIWIYPSERLAGTKVVYLHPGIRNILDYKMKDASSVEIIFEQLKPEVRFTGKGTILPSTDGLVLPFEAVNLKSVDVHIMKIFENNILQFLQVNRIDGSYEMHRVGQRSIRKTISLETSGVTDLGKWNRFTLDLSTLIKTEPGAIYQVKISFRKKYSVYHCDNDSEGEMTEIEDEDEPESYGYYDEEGYYYEDYYYDYDYDWSERDNPCNSAYYRTNRNIEKNVLASDLGLIAKQGSDGITTAFVNDLKTTLPLSGVTVELYDFQQQLVGMGVTSEEGKVAIETNVQPFALVAKQGAQRGYLRLQPGEALSVSTFDVSGQTLEEGLKGLIYGERGVWRPGDSLYLTFVLEDENKTLPANHPVVFELQNPQGQITSRIVKSTSVDGFYHFATATVPDAPTGNWTGKVKVGGATFSRQIRIETVKPNRLKIKLDFGSDRLVTNQVSGTLDVKWLHGSPGRNLKAEFDVLFNRVPTTFKKYEKYTFEDPTRDFYSEAQSIYSGYTNSEGKAEVSANFKFSSAVPGFLKAVFRGKVFEESGNFSIDNFSLPYYPYTSYVGLKVPEGERYTNILYTDTVHTLDIVTLDIDGKPVNRDNLQVKLYKVDTRWWWDYSYYNIANYISRNYNSEVKSTTVNTKNGKAAWSFSVKAPDWGRYFIQVCDPGTGHCSGRMIYIDEPGWYSRYRGTEQQTGANLLSFSTDKVSYNIGEKIKLNIPGSDAGRALISIENGSKVLETFWMETKKGDNTMSIDVTPNMTPNVFVNVSLIQPHAQTVNDLPIRLYGIVPLRIEDPKTHLEPVLTMPDELEPGEQVVIKVSEKNKQKMTYTVAVVDEGLLDLTHFNTPDLWKHFYANEALGVRSWDVYDQVMGAFGAKIERLLAIGGDGELEAKEDDARANRFKPVVKFFGPFTLDGGTATHTFTMPQYVGSVRTMVVAGYNGAYGSTEKATPVRKPLMVLATLPRVLGPEEKVKLPITLFTADKSIREVKIELKASGPLTIQSKATRTVSVSSVGDMTVDFDLAVPPSTGVAKIEVEVSSGRFKANDVIEIEVRNPNTPVTRVADVLLEPGKSWDTNVVPFGVEGTNSATLEVSNIPPINLESRLRYLIRYPYGCIEQTTSAVFPQLYLDQVKALNDNEKAVIQRNVTAGIEKLKSFVLKDGSFSYWPGQSYYDEWGTTYAGHFLVEAKTRGYYVPEDIIRSWVKFQRKMAKDWKRENRYNTDLMQAYRLYALSLAGSAELGAMNRLRETSGITSVSRWMLAAAYAKAGQPEAAKKLIANLDLNVKDYRELNYSYGSGIRDKALIIETLVLLNEKTKAFELLKELSDRLSNTGYWMSTQEVAFSLKAIASFVGMEKRGELRYNYTIAGKKTNASSVLPVSQVDIPLKTMSSKSVTVYNEGKSSLFVRLISTGTPARGDETDEENNLSMAVRYTDIKGNPIDPSRLVQGTEFVAEVEIAHPGRGLNTYQNMALSQVFPSGWEINNLRLEGAESFLQTDPFTYQDIRDDRVYTYFDLYSAGRKTYRVMLTAAYAGTFYLPATSCEAMYDKSKYARKKGQVVEVIKPDVQ